MILLLDNYKIQIQSLRSEMEFFELSKEKRITKYFGEKGQSTKKWQVLLWSDGDLRIDARIFSKGFSIQPFIFICSRSQTFFLAHDFFLSHFNLRTGSLEKTTTLDVPVMEIVPFVDLGTLVVVHEIGIETFSLTGKFLWRHQTDLVEDFVVENGRISLLLFNKKRDIVVVGEMGAAPPKK